MPSSVERLVKSFLPAELAAVIALIRSLRAEPVRSPEALRALITVELRYLDAQRLHALAEVAAALRAIPPR